MRQRHCVSEALDKKMQKIYDSINEEFHDECEYNRCCNDFDDDASLVIEPKYQILADDTFEDIKEGLDTMEAYDQAKLEAIELGLTGSAYTSYVRRRVRELIINDIDWVDNETGEPKQESFGWPMNIDDADPEDRERYEREHSHDCENCDEKLPFESLKEDIITEAQWKMKLQNGPKLRQCINDNDLRGTVDTLIACWEEIRDNTEDEEDAAEVENTIEDLTYSLYAGDELDYDAFGSEEELADSIDFYLNDFFDYCDAYKIWVSLDESLNEGVVDDELTARKFLEDEVGLEIYPLEQLINSDVDEDQEIIDYMKENKLNYLLSKPELARFWYCYTLAGAKKFFDNGGQIGPDNHGEIIEESINEDRKDYDENEWSPEDIELHKSINWKDRNYEDYPVEGDIIDGEATYYDIGHEPVKKQIKFQKHLRANPIFSPYYKPMEEPFSRSVGSMYDGHKHGIYGIHDRFESPRAYDMFSEALNEEESKYQIKFKEYCKDKISNDLGVVNDDGVEYEVIMLSDSIRTFEDIQIVNDEDDPESLVGYDKNNERVIDTPMISAPMFAVRLEFDRILKSFYDMIIEYWDEMYLDEVMEEEELDEAIDDADWKLIYSGTDDIHKYGEPVRELTDADKDVVARKLINAESQFVLNDGTEVEVEFNKGEWDKIYSQILRQFRKGHLKGRIDECAKSKIKYNRINEGKDIYKYNSVGKMINSHTDELDMNATEAELKKQLIGLLNKYGNEVSDKKGLMKAKELFTKLRGSRLYSTIGTYMTGDKVSEK